MIRENLETIKNNVARICRQINKNPDDIIFVCVTKTVGVSEIEEALSCGVSVLGENRVQSAVEKNEVLHGRVLWHLIGHLQTNKVKPAVKLFDLIHSVDSLKIARKIQDEALKINKIQDVLLEVNLSLETSKYGFKKEEVLEVLGQISQLSNVKVLGLMTMAPLVDDVEKTRPIFSGLRKLSELVKGRNIANIEMRYLSMGMSQDYEVALSEGSNMIRVGSAVFGN